MARELGVPLHEFDFGGSRIGRQQRAVRATVALLLQARPRVVFASNPSLVLTCLLLVCRTFFRFRLASDAHYGGVVAVTGSRATQRLLDFVNRRVDVVIVTNSVHARRIRDIGGTAFVCPDPLPRVTPSPRPSAMNGAGKSVLFICSFDLDEPFGEVFEAARTLARNGYTLYVSGRYWRAGLSPEAVPHAMLLGYVDRDTYDGYLGHVDVVLDLTTWEDCLVCGAYEAMAAGRPCVLSRTPALTELFTHGTVFSSHTPADIAAAVEIAYERREALRAEIAPWVARHEMATRQRVMVLRTTLGLPALAG